MFTIKFEPDH